MTQYLMKAEAHRPVVIDVLCYGDAERVAGMETRRTDIHHDIDQHAECHPGKYLCTIYCDMPGKTASPVYVFEEQE